MSRKSSDILIHTAFDEPAPSRNRIHLWLFDLDTIENWEKDRSILSRDELQRADRLKDRPARCRSITSSALVRRIIANLCETKPEELVFARGMWGKPRLVPLESHSRISQEVNFNLSHSENVLALALAFSLDIGVDVEVVDRQKNSFAFYRAWTMQEATAKMAGVGIASRKFDTFRNPLITRVLQTKFAGKEVLIAIAADLCMSGKDPIISRFSS